MQIILDSRGISSEDAYMESTPAQKSIWMLMQDNAGGILDDAEQRAGRDNRILRDAPAKPLETGLTASQVADSPYQMNAQSQFEAARAASQNRSLANEKFLRYKDAGLSTDEINEMGVFWQK